MIIIMIMIMIMIINFINTQFWGNHILRRASSRGISNTISKKYLGRIVMLNKMIYNSNVDLGQ